MEAVCMEVLVRICAGVSGNRYPYRYQWSPRGAHLLLQTRTKVLNQELEDTFRQWYPAFRPMPLSEAA